MQKLQRQFALVVLDAVIIQLSFLMGFYLRFEGILNQDPAKFFVTQYFNVWLWVTVIKLTIFALFNMYHSLWRYASVEELFQVFFAALFGSLGLLSLIYFLQVPMPRSVVIISGVFDLLMLGASRFGYRSLRLMRDVNFRGLLKTNENRVLIYGAGEAGAMVAKEIKNQPFNGTQVVGFVDDNAVKRGRRINGVPVMGGRSDVAHLVKKHHITEIIIAIPSNEPKKTQEIMAICAQTAAKLRILPSLAEIIDGKVSVSAIRNVEIEDLLGRDEVVLNASTHGQLIRGKTVLVTGAGGSIGSEIVRQIMPFEPKQVVLFDISENNVYNLQQELMRAYGHPPLVVLIGSVRDLTRVEEVFERHKPEIVFHAAAHKHVPLMEDSPKEAVKNNILGTYNVILTAQKHGVERLVQISTDKAVNPTNVMGATKRACEILIQAMNGLSKTELIAVRFGNVLGSEGSVIPLFKKQIASGGPVTVTHRDIIRYFMTIPEASRLVIQAASLGHGGEIFVLDMGEPVKIYDLAEKMIRLSGFEPHRDIDIVITGLRPGEKLYEELLIDDLHTVSTELRKVFIERTTPLDWDVVQPKLEVLLSVDGYEVDVVKQALKEMVPTYQCVEG